MVKRSLFHLIRYFIIFEERYFLSDPLLYLFNSSFIVRVLLRKTLREGEASGDQQYFFFTEGAATVCQTTPARNFVPLRSISQAELGTSVLSTNSEHISLQEVRQGSLLSPRMVLAAKVLSCIIFCGFRYLSNGIVIVGYCYFLQVTV